MRNAQKSTQKSAYFILLFLILIIDSIGQLPQSFTYYSQIQGLPDNHVKAIAQDKYGYIWTGTENGLARFDGKYFTTFSLSNSLSALPSTDIYALQNIDSNHLGVVTRRGLQIIDVENMTSTNLIIPKGPLAYEDKANHLRRIHVTENKEIIIVSRSGFYHYNKEWKLIFRYDDYSREESLNALSFGEFSHWLNEQNLVIAGNLGIFQYNTRTKILKAVQQGDKSYLLFGTPELFSKTSNYYVLQPTMGCFVILNYDRDSLVYIDERAGIVTASKTHLDSIGSKFTWRSKVFFLNDTTLLLSGKFNGLYTLNINTKTGHLVLDTTSNLTNKKCNYFFLDNRNRCWIGFNDGLACENISPINLQLHPTAGLNEAKSNRNVVLQTAFTSKNIYASATVSGGIHQFNKASLAFEKTILFDFKSTGNKSLYTVENWIGDSILCGGDRGLFLYDEKRDISKYVDLPNWTPGRNWVANLFMDSKQNMWISTNKPSGCYIWRKGEKSPGWFPIGGNHQKSLKEVYHFAEDKDGNIWLSGNGIIRYNTSKKLFDYYQSGISKSNGEPTPVAAIDVDRKGLVWLANGASGLACLNPNTGRIELFRLKDGLPDEAIKDLKYVNGFVYITSKNGIAKIDCETKKISVVTTIKDVYYQNYFSNKLVYDHTTHSFFTGAGSSVIRFEPPVAGKIKNEPQLLLDFVKWGPDSINWFPKSGLKVNWKDKNVTLFYNGINFEDADYQKYAYRTIRKGKASEWIMQDDQRRIIFSNLEKGTTRVEIKLFSPQNAWPPKIIFYNIYVKTPFWKATWFYLLCSLLSIALIFFVYRQREKQIMKIFEIRGNISKDLHDEIGATLSGISMYSHLTKGQLQSNNLAGANQSLQVIQQSSADMVSKLNDIVWLINPGQDSLQKLLQRLEEYAGEMAVAKNMSVEISLPDQLSNKELSLEARRNIYLICKEAINNAVKYSGGTILGFDVKQDGNTLHFTITDNGQGFDSKSVKPGNGLRNIQLRAKELGAELRVESGQGKGTILSFSLVE